MLTGDLADINTMLAGVAYGGVSAGATDNVQVSVTDANNATAAQTIAVTTNTVPFTDVVVNALGRNGYFRHAIQRWQGVSLSDPVCRIVGSSGISYPNARTNPLRTYYQRAGPAVRYRSGKR